jgi:hypothetical protein
VVVLIALSAANNSYLSLFAKMQIAYSPGSRYTGLLKVKVVAVGDAELAVTFVAFFTTVLKGITTEGDGYPETVGRI